MDVAHTHSASVWINRRILNKYMASSTEMINYCKTPKVSRNFSHERAPTWRNRVAHGCVRVEKHFMSTGNGIGAHHPLVPFTLQHRLYQHKRTHTHTGHTQPQKCASLWTLGNWLRANEKTFGALTARMARPRRSCTSPLHAHTHNHYNTSIFEVRKDTRAARPPNCAPWTKHKTSRTAAPNASTA